MIVSKDNKSLVEVEQKDYFTELDRRDQQQIVMHTLGEVVDDLFYEVHGQKSLSWEGINTVAFFMGDIEVDPWIEWERIEMFEGRVYWSATVRARNTKYNLASLGTAETSELMDVYDRDEKNQKIPIPNRRGEFKTHLEPDEHCRRKALSKAQRNAKKAVMPTAVMNKWLQYFVGMKLYKKGTRQQKPEMPFKPKTVDAEYQVLNVEKSLEPIEEEPTAPIQPVKPSEEKPRARVGDPPRKTPFKPVAEDPKTREEQLQVSPKGIEEVRGRIADYIVGSDTLIVVSNRGNYFRVGKKKRLDEEIEYKIDSLVAEMGGLWDKEANAWMISKEDSP